MRCLLIFVIAILSSTPAFALVSNKDLRLDDGEGDSPSVVVKDGDDETGEFQRKGGNLEIRTTDGAVHIKPSGGTSKGFAVRSLLVDRGFHRLLLKLEKVLEKMNTSHEKRGESLKKLGNEQMPIPSHKNS